MGLVRLCLESDVEDSSIRRFVIEGKEVLLGKLQADSMPWTTDVSIAGGPLLEGTLDGGIVTCLGILGGLT